MNFLKLLICPLIMGASLLAGAQTVTVNPTPRSIVTGEKAFASPVAIKIDGEKTADADAVALLQHHFATDSKNGVKVTIGERGDKAVKSVANKIPQQSEGYYLSITPKGVIIAGNDPKGTYYGVQTFLQLASVPEVMSAEVSDWPAVGDRGVVEGFYGNPWTLENRIHQFDFYGANKLNTYIYGPKDDPYHHSRWREPYPADRAEVMKKMAEAAAKNKVWFVWAMHPGNSIESADDRAAALAKFESMYDMGFRAFAVFFDDISNYDAAKQADYLNFITDNFIHKHDDVAPLIMCPSQYNKLWAGDGAYLRELGSKTYPEVRIMWTGNSVVDMINKEDVEWVEGNISRKPFIWLNWPVNDYCVNHLLMGPMYGNDTDIADDLSGFTLNPMEYAEASLVSIYQGADYLWNPESYDSEASWLRAVNAIAPAGLEDETLTFCKYNIDLGPNTHRLRRMEESPEMQALIAAYNANPAQATPQLRAEFDKISAAATKLLATADTCAFTAEVAPWLKVMEMLGRRGNLALDITEALAKGDTIAFIDTYKKYYDLTDEASRVESRNFEGSIKVAYPTVGSLYTEPLLKQLLTNAISDYRANYTYMVDMLPAPVIENGVYRIMVNGKYLGNPQAGGIGGRPVLEDKEDDVNPDRQLWRIVLDPLTDRYQIVNAKDGRYLNEQVAFSRNPESNPYDRDWHTFVIEREGDKYAIRNGGNGGNSYWSVEEDHLAPGSRQKSPANFIFELVGIGAN